MIQNWPKSQFDSDAFRIALQQDGAKAHTGREMLPSFKTEMRRLARLDVLPRADKIQLVAQPANSPDCDICDLGFFRAPQSVHCQEAPRNVGELITMVEDAHNDCSFRKMNRIWVTYQSVLNEIIQCNGGNDYHIPHMNKNKLEKEGKLPECLEVCKSGESWLKELHPHLEQNIDNAAQQEDTSSDGSFAQEHAELNVHPSEWEHLFVTD